MGRIVRGLAVVAAAVALVGAGAVAPAAAAGTGTVRGRITDETGAPSASQIALLPLTGGDSVYSYSEADGTFTIPAVPAGDYRFLINDNAHPPQYAHGAESAEDADPVVVTEGGVTTVDEQYLPLGTLVVTVVDAATRRPVPGACVRLDPGNGQACGTARGVVRLPAWPGLVTATVYDPAGGHWPTTVESLTVDRGRTTRTTAALAPAASITATVVNGATGRPVAACVRLADPRGHGLLPGCPHQSDAATGTVVIGPVEATTAQLFVEPLDSALGALWVTRTGGSGDQRDARVVTAAVGRPVRLPAIEVAAAGSITGTVLDRATGAPLNSVCAYPFAFDPRLGNDRRCTDSTGRYTISGLGPYRWPVLFTSAPVFGKAWQWSGDVADRFSARLVPVRSGAAATLDTRMVDGGTVTGTVVDGAGTPRFAEVDAYNARTGDFAAGSTTTAPSQEAPFAVRGLATQTVKLEYRAAGDCWYRDRTSFATATPLPVTAGATVGPLTLVDCG
jgi:hypothetical protein